MRIKEWYFNTPEDYDKQAVSLAAKGELLKATESIPDGENSAHSNLTSIEKAKAHIARLKDVEATSPHLQAYLNREGRIEVAKVGLGRPKTRVSYTRLGFVIDTPRGLHRAGIKKKTTEGDNVLSSDALIFAYGDNKAVERFANLPPKQLLKRMARYIDPKSIGLGFHLNIEPI